MAVAQPCPEVIVLSNEQDVSVDWVVRELRQNGVRFLRLNTERLPAWTVVIDPVDARWEMRLRDRCVDLSSVRSIWYRRPEPPTSDRIRRLTTGQRALVVEQWQGLLDGLAALPADWVNDPTANRAAESKIVQLNRARKAGLDVPRTIVRNDLDILEDVAATRQWIVKGLSAPLLTEPDGTTAFVFSEWLTPELLAEPVCDEQAPMILQQAVWPKQDVRVTVVGQDVQAAITSSPTLDWRVSYRDVTFVAHPLPSEVIEACLRLTRELRLEFAGIDLVRDGAGHYLFLELNPNGEWGWLQKSAGLRIAEAIAARLSR